MKIVHFCCALFLVVGILKPTESFGQWVRTDGPQGGYVKCFDMDSTNVFAGTLSAGVFRSTDGGFSWFSSGMVDLGVNALKHVGSSYYAATNAGVYRSTDGGSTWIESNLGLGAQPIASLAISGTYIFVGRSFYVASEFISGGVFLSTDAGVSWSPSGLSGLPIQAIVGTDTSVFAVTGGTLFVSGDTGKNWNPVGLHSGIVALTMRSGNLYACSSSGQVLLSRDGGVTWDSLTSIPSSQYGYGLASGSNSLYAWTNDSVFVLPDSETSWTAVNLGLGTPVSNEPMILGIMAFGSEVYVGTYGYGIVHSANAGIDWSPGNSGLNETVPVSLVSAGDILYAGTQYPGKLFKTSDAGVTWSNIRWPVAAYAVKSIVVSNMDIYVGCYASGVFHSRDAGVSWVECNSGLTNLNVDALALSGNCLVAGTYGGGLFVSRDSALTWSPVGPLSLGVTGLSVSGNNVLAGANSRVMLSTNSGLSWAYVDSGIIGKFVNCVAISGRRLLAGTDGSGVLLSDNFGSSWVAAGPPNAFVRSLMLTDTIVFAGSPDHGILLSTDGGTRWKSVNNGLLDSSVTALATHGEYLFAGTNGHGVWRRAISEMITSVVDRWSESPRFYALAQNYPNPFNPSTTIRFSVPARSRVRLTIFNLLGQQVAELADEEMNAGSYERMWNANVASGMYFYRIEAVSVTDPGKRFVDVKKMVLLR